MADIRIKDLPTTASLTASDDFIAIDGTTNGTRKLSAAAPAFLTSVTTPSLTSPAATNLTLGLGTGGTALTLTNSTLAATFAGAITVSGGSALVQSGTADPFIHIQVTTDNPYNPYLRFEGYNRNFFMGVRDTGADGLFSIAATSALTSPLFSINAATLAATFSGAVSVGTGAAVGGATAGAGGLAFPATAVAVADANTLDDYEEGTWTPVVSDASSGGNLATLSDAEGVYTKIGNIVYWRFNVVLTSKASASAGNTVFIQGLPFQSATIPNGWYNPCATIIRNITFSGYVQFNVSGSNSYGYFRENVSSAAGDDITFSDLTNSAAMQVSGFYKVA